VDKASEVEVFGRCKGEAELPLSFSLLSHHFCDGRLASGSSVISPTALELCGRSIVVAVIIAVIPDPINTVSDSSKRYYRPLMPTLMLMPMPKPMMLLLSEGWNIHNMQ
jgi:hypothetical protein